MAKFRSDNPPGIDGGEWVKLEDGTLVGNGTRYQFGSRLPKLPAVFQWREKAWAMHITGTIRIYLPTSIDGPKLNPEVDWSMGEPWSSDPVAAENPPDFTSGGAGASFTGSGVDEHFSDGTTETVSDSPTEIVYHEVPTEVSLQVIAGAPQYIHVVRNAVIATTGEIITGLSYWANFSMQVKAVGKTLGYFDIGIATETASSDVWTSEWYDSTTPGLDDSHFDPLYDLSVEVDVSAANPQGMDSEFGSSFTIRRPRQGPYPPDPLWEPDRTQIEITDIVMAGREYWLPRAPL